MFIDFLFSLKFSEIFFLISLLIICLWDVGKNYIDKNWIKFSNPTTLYGVLIFFYCLVGPIISSGMEDGSIMYRGVNHREFYEIGLIAAIISYLSFLFGFNSRNHFKIKKFGINKLKEYRLKTKDYLFIYKWGERIILFTFFLQFLTYGPLLISRILSTNDSFMYIQFYTGFGSYLLTSSVNFLIFGLILLFVSLLNGIKERTKFIFYLAITVGLFLNLGFRYRLFILILPLFLIYLFYKKIKPSIKLLISLFLSAMLFFGFIQIARGYGTGLNYEQFQNKISQRENSIFEYIFRSAFYDTNVFNTAAGIIYLTPKEINYAGIKPVINAIAVPIPRRLWRGKPSGDYLKNCYKGIYPGLLWDVGSANLGFAEYYLAGGWIALIITNFFIGLFFKKTWFHFLLNFNDPIARIRYCLYLSYLYVIFTRGYLLQLTFIYFSIFIPFHFFSYIWNKKYR